MKRPKVRAHGFDGSVRLLGHAQASLSPCFRGLGLDDRDMPLGNLSVRDLARMCVSCNERFRHSNGQVHSGGACGNKSCLFRSRDSWQLIDACLVP